jgi:SH3-like domain-containing protein
MTRISFILLIFLIVSGTIPSLSQEISPAFRSSGLPIPRFVSLRSDKVFVRSGPGTKYPVKWVYTQQYLPLEVVLEFETWRKVRDIEGQEGWVHQSLLSGRRTAFVQAKARVALKPRRESTASPTALLEPLVLLDLNACEAGWCKAEIMGMKPQKSGWIEKTFLWGVYDSEKFD